MLKDYTHKLRMTQKKKSKEKKQYVSKKEKRDKKKLNTDSYNYPLTKFEKEYIRLFPEEK